MVSTFYKHLSPRPGSCIWRQRLHDHLQQRLSHLGMSWAQYSPHCKPLVRQLWWCRNTEIKRSFIWYFQHSYLSRYFFLFHNDAVPLVQLKRPREASFSFTYAVGKPKSSRPPNIEGGNSVSCDWIQSECQDIGPVFPGVIVDEQIQAEPEEGTPALDCVNLVISTGNPWQT